MYPPAMQIDRSRFLLLTTAIAAGNAACTPGEASSPTSVATVTEAPDASAPPTAEGMSPTREGGGGPTREGGMGPTREGGMGPTREGGSSPVREGAPIASATPTASSTAPLPPGCPDSDNMVGTVGNCGTLRAPGPQCESFNDTKDDCSHLARGFKPRVAQKAVACILAKSGTQAICDFQLTQKCSASAAADSCLDPATGPTCDSIMAACSGGGRGRGRGTPLTKVACMHALSSLTGSNRSRVGSCIAESCGVELCFYDLK